MIQLINELATQTATDIKASITAKGLEVGPALKKAIEGEKSHVNILFGITIALLLVLSFLSIKGANWVISGVGPMIAMGCVGMSIILLVMARFGVIRGKAKYVTLGVELLLMAFMAYVTPGIMAASQIDTQHNAVFNKLDMQTNSEFVKLTQLNAEFQNLPTTAKTVMDNEERRNGKGIVWETMNLIYSDLTAKTASLTIPKSIVSIERDSSINSLSSLNEDILNGIKHYQGQIETHAATARSVRDDLQKSLDVANNILDNGKNKNGSSLSEGQKQSLTYFITQIAPTIEGYEGDAFTLDVKTLSRSDLDIPSFFKILPFAFELVVLVLMFLFLRALEPKDDLLTAARKEAKESAMRKMLQTLGIKFDDTAILANDATLLGQLEVIQESKLGKAVRGKDVSELEEIIDDADALKVAFDKNNTFTIETVHSLKALGMRDADIAALAKDLTDDQVGDLKSKTGNAFSSVIKTDIAALPKLAKSIRKIHKGIRDKDAAIDLIENLYEQDVDEKTFAQVDNLIETLGVDKANKVNWKILSHFTEKNASTLTNMLSQCRINMVTEVCNKWSASNTRVLNEIEEAGLFKGQFKSVFRTASINGYHAIEAIFDSYQNAKDGIDENLTNPQPPMLNTNADYLKSVFGATTIDALITLLEGIFVLPNNGTV